MKRTIKRRTEITIETHEIKTIHLGADARSGLNVAGETSIVELRPLVSATPVPESRLVDSRIEVNEEPKS